MIPAVGMIFERKNKLHKLVTQGHLESYIWFVAKRCSVASKEECQVWCQLSFIFLYFLFYFVSLMFVISDPFPAHCVSRLCDYLLLPSCFTCVNLSSPPSLVYSVCVFTLSLSDCRCSCSGNHTLSVLVYVFSCFVCILGFWLLFFVHVQFQLSCFPCKNKLSLSHAFGSQCLFLIKNARMSRINCLVWSQIK